MIRAAAVAVVAGVAGLLGAGAPAATAGPIEEVFGPVYGGGAIATQASRTFAIGILDHDDNNPRFVEVRLTITLGCARRPDGRLRTVDVEQGLTARPAADGTFHVRTRRAAGRGFGPVRVTLDGRLDGDRADGTVRVVTGFACGRGLRRWTARRVDVAAPPVAPPAPVDGDLYGVTGAFPVGPPHGLVARVSGGGRRVRLLTSVTAQCQLRADGEELADPTAYAVRPPVLAVGPAGLRWRTRDGAAVTTLRGSFSGDRLRGTVRQVDRYRGPDVRMACDSGAAPFAAVP